MVVLRLANHDLLVAMDGLGVILLCMIHVSQLSPCFHIRLVDLCVLVEKGNRIINQVHIAVQSYQSLS